MRKLIRIIHLEDMDEILFINYLDMDRVRHVFTICDLKNMREKTKVWIALINGRIAGYIFEYDKRIVHTHGNPETIPKLLSRITLDEPILVIEPDHLKAVEKVFEPVERMDPATKGLITTFLVMKADVDNFKPVIRHSVKKLGTEDLEEAFKSFGEELKKLSAERH